MNQEHPVTGIPLGQKDAPQFNEGVSVNISTSRPKPNLWRANYTESIHIGWIAFSLAVVWGGIFCVMNRLGVHAAVLAGFSCIAAMVAGIAYDTDERHIAGVTFPIHALGIILFTTLFVFNPSKEYVAVYGDTRPTVIHYAQEPWITRSPPEVWRNALFFKRSFTTTINKYVDFDKKEILVKFTVDFVLSSEKAKTNFASLNEEVMSKDKNAASEIMAALVVDTVKKVMDDREFLQNIESADTLLYSLPLHERHEIKQKMFRGALENALPNSQGDTLQTILYLPDPSSTKITVGNAIYTGPSN